MKVNIETVTRLADELIEGWSRRGLLAPGEAEDEISRSLIETLSSILKTHSIALRKALQRRESGSFTNRVTICTDCLPRHSVRAACNLAPSGIQCQACERSDAQAFRYVMRELLTELRPRGLL